MLFFAVICSIGITYAQPKHMSDIGFNTIPSPFTEIDTSPLARTSPAISTGYYFMDNQSTSEGIWKPSPNPNGNTGLLPLTFEEDLWYQIYSGPRQVPVNEFESGYDIVNRLILPPPTGKTPREGYRYFRNPAQYPDYSNRMYKNPGIDTTKNAIAGPIPIGFAFYVNGIRYDSFYVSPRGIIALSNRRYLYDGEGRRAIPPNKTDCYDPMSADWPFPNDASNPTQGRYHAYPGNLTGNSINDPIADNYGFVNLACGGDPMNATSGIRTPMIGSDNNVPTASGSMRTRLANNIYAGGAFVTPLEGPFWLPQFDERTQRADHYGEVYYKRSMTSDRLIIYFKNLQMESGTYQFTQGGQVRETFNIDPTGMGRAGMLDPVTGAPIAGTSDINTVAGSCQVELNRIDSSITFRYGNWVGSAYRVPTSTTQAPTINPANVIMQPFASVAVGGYARHKGYDTKDPSTYTRTETNPWSGQYVQVTQEYNGYLGKTVDMQQRRTEILTTSFEIKFKQWRNALRLADVQYFVRKKTDTATAFNDPVKTDAVNDFYNPFELLAGHEQLGILQPVGIIQNLTNDIQSPTGVNFVEQDFQFRARLLIRNKITDKYVYNRFAKVSNTCLRLPENTNSSDCGADPYYLVRYSDVVKSSAGVYTATPKALSSLPENLNGIPTYRFALVKFPTYRPNEIIDNQIGIMELACITEAVDPNTNAVIGDEWPFDDSAKISFWVINRLREFRDNGEFHNLTGVGNIPNANKWVYSGFSRNQASVEIVQSDQSSSLNPLPPVGDIAAINNDRSILPSPMIKMYWSNVDNTSLGSKITSFPIDMRGKEGSLVTLAVQRAAANIDVQRGFADATMFGPEPRVVFVRGYDTTGSKHSGKIDNMSGNGTNADPDFDYLAVEFLRPSLNGIRNITMTGSDSNKNDNFNQTNNSPNAFWRHHPYWKGSSETAPIVENAPALAIYGGGGYFLGWSFADKKTYYPASWNGGVTPPANDQYAGGGVTIYNSVLDRWSTVLYPNPSDNSLAQYRIAGGLQFNPYDDGFDFEFYRYSVPVPDYFIQYSPVDLGKNFRFRIKVVETNYDGTGDQLGVTGPNPVNPADDEDDFFVDNVAVMFPDNSTDIEAQIVKFLLPYAKIPVNQAVDIPVVVRLANMGTRDANPFTVKVKIYRGDITPGAELYCKTVSVAQLPKSTATEITMPTFSPKNFTSSNNGNEIFVLQVIALYPDDIFRINDTTRKNETIMFSDEFAYAADGAINDVEASSIGTGMPGKGLNLLGNSFSGFLNPGTGNPAISSYSDARPNYAHPNEYLSFWQLNPAGEDPLPWIEYIAGGSIDAERLGYPHAGITYVSGEIATKFVVGAKDNLSGVRATFAGANQAFDDISFTVYNDNNGVPGNLKYGTMFGRRMMSKTPGGTETYVPVGSPVLYQFPTPISLEKGTYWIAIGQLGETGLELAGSAQSMGMRTMLVGVTTGDYGQGVGQRGIMGRTGIQLMLDKRFRTPQTISPYGRVYVNNNVFAYKNVIGSGNTWKQFMPTTGDVAYAHLDHLGTLGAHYNNYKTFTRGTWLPLLTPYFGLASVVADDKYYPCDDDVNGSTPLSIEITSFTGNARNGGIDLTWETASETNNHSFIVERSEIGNDAWDEVDNVAGAGTTTTPQIYGMRDNNVVSGHTYQYRLYNMDFDGAISCQNNNIITVEYNDNNILDLAQNSPNPFATETYFKLTVPNQNVTLQVLDIFGRVVRTIVDNQLLNGTNEYSWNGSNEGGAKVADGNYILRLVAGNEIITKKISYIKTR
jgi:hypothetical protein